VHLDSACYCAATLHSLTDVSQIFPQVAKKLSLSGDKEAAELAARAQTLLTELYKGKPNAPMLDSLIAQLNTETK
jgi:hypothetical protein